jgi:hypothetical protein
VNTKLSFFHYEQPSQSSLFALPYTKGFWSPSCLEGKSCLRLMYRISASSLIAFLALGEFFWNVTRAIFWKKPQPLQRIDGKVFIVAGICSIAAISVLGYHWAKSFPPHGTTPFPIDCKKILYALGITGFLFVSVQTMRCACRTPEPKKKAPVTPTENKELSPKNVPEKKNTTEDKKEGPIKDPVSPSGNEDTSSKDVNSGEKKKKPPTEVEREKTVKDKIGKIPIQNEIEQINQIKEKLNSPLPKQKKRVLEKKLIELKKKISKKI